MDMDETHSPRSIMRTGIQHRIIIRNFLEQVMEGIVLQFFIKHGTAPNNIKHNSMWRKQKVFISNKILAHMEGKVTVIIIITSI